MTRNHSIDQSRPHDAKQGQFGSLNRAPPHPSVWQEILAVVFYSPRPPIDSAPANHRGISALGVQVKVTHPLKIHQRSSDLGVRLCCSAILLPRHSQKFSYTSPFVWRSERNLWVRWCIPVLSSVFSSAVFSFLARHNLMENS